jgi:hypothetical protein
MDTVKDFYQPATSVLSTQTDFSLQQQSVQPHPYLASFFDERQIQFLTAKINGRGQIVLLGSPEAYALTTGLIHLDDQLQLKLLPARLFKLLK